MSKDFLDKYFNLMQSRPQLFQDSSVISIVTDRKEIEEYIHKTGKHIGVIYESSYSFLVVDLVRYRNGPLFPYERIIPAANGRSMVCIPVYKGKYVLLKQYRHAIRAFQICFPRGYGENNLSSYEIAQKELSEEIGASVESCEKLGCITVDSGLSSAWTDVFICHISDFDIAKKVEGIEEIILCSPEELALKIAHREITDSFTICSYEMMKNRQ